MRIEAWKAYARRSERTDAFGSLVQTIPVGNDPAGISSDGTNVWVANQIDNTVIDLVA